MDKIRFTDGYNQTFAISRKWFKEKESELTKKLRPFFDCRFETKEGFLKAVDTGYAKNIMDEMADIILREAFSDIEASGIEFIEARDYEADFSEEFNLLKSAQKKIKDAGADDIIRVTPIPDDFFDNETGCINKEITVNGESYLRYIQTAMELENEISLLLEGKKSVIPTERKYPELTPEEILAKRANDGRVEGYIHLHISDMIDNDFEAFLDILSERLIGNACLQGIDYETVTLADNEPNTVILKVSGFVDASDID